LIKTVISDQVSKDYSEWFLGHSESPYYTMKEQMRCEIYVTKCMKYLTYLDYSALESTGKSIEKKLEAREDKIQIKRTTEIIRIPTSAAQRPLYGIRTSDK
jgi:hypothetical protein